MDDLSDKISSFLKDPENLEKIKSFAGFLDTSKGNGDSEGESGGGEKSSDDLFGAFNPEMLLKLKSVMDKTNTRDDNRINLLLALKPYLGDKRKERMESAMKMIKFSKLAAIIGDNFKF